VEGQHYLDKRARRLIEDGTSNGAAPDDLLTTKQTAEWLGMSWQWLEIGRSRGYGPPFIKLHQRVKYRRDAVVQWLESRTYKSTMEYETTPFAGPYTRVRPFNGPTARFGFRRRD
jgi:hypothetical protein